uniref:Transcription factor GAMYB n=1 Tax=Leersia perrieri TaxID=77586 RepID=A0A0D9VVV5_9ORYZ
MKRAPEEKGEEMGEEEEEVALKKGPWTTAEDAELVQHVRQHGEGNWNSVQRMTSLLRCGKSCRLRWTNHLRPNLKKGSFSPDEELLIAQLHAQLGNKWARMASHLPGRTDNEIKNYWNTRAKRRQRAGLPIYPPEVQLNHHHLNLNFANANAKRRRYDDFFSSSSLSPPQSASASNVLLSPDDAAAAAGYTSARPAPLDLAGQLAMGGNTSGGALQFLAATPFSAPSSPWAKPFARNAHFFRFPHSSPVSPTTPPTPTTGLSLGGYGLGLYHAGDRTARLFPPVSQSLGARVELPSTQFRPAMTPAAATGGLAGGGGGALMQDHPNAASFEAMMQELHDVIKTESPVPAANGGGETGGVISGDSKLEVELKDDIETLFDIIIPATFATAAPESLTATTAASAPNNSGSVSQHSSDDQDHSNGADVTIDLPVLTGGGGDGDGSSEQEWCIDGATCQWNNMSGGIC